MRLAEALADGDVVFLAADDARAAAVSRALAAAAPDAAVIHCPGSDALPGDSAPASPANAGLRVAALHRLCALQGSADRPRIALISTGEAAARLYPPASAFDGAPPTVRVGDAIEPDAFVERMLALGYLVWKK